MVRLIARAVRDRRGGVLAEYALIVAGVALIAAVAIAVFGRKTSDMIATAAAVMPGAHAEDNAPIVSGKLIETSPNAQGTDQGGNSQNGIGLDVNAITQGTGKARLSNAVGGDGSVSSLVLEPAK